eukprot:TRINITY_DN9285_c0_g1_i1.p1 TRINITY_DN9285_c0_g1~~TRINITY_DN9285_c0_g1_i1.p1  ORF type:complete len:353 (+),score=98.30 TRINITY_DN9285_c0_g1_i1:982-2040(+)
MIFRATRASISTSLSHSQHSHVMSKYTEEELEALLEVDAKEVEIDALVALKIINHSKSNLPTLVTGQLLGLNLGPSLEVTDAFPLPFKQESGGVSYDLEMLTRLQNIGVDNNTVGWYQSSYLGLHVNKFLVSTQSGYQKDIHNSVVLVYDPMTTAKGGISLRAFKLSAKFMKLIEMKQYSAENIAKLDFTSSDLFVELPTKIRTNNLHRLLVQFLLDKPELTEKFEHLDLSSSEFFTSNLDVLLSCLQDLQKEQHAYSGWQRSAQRSQEQQQAFISQRKADNIVRKKKGQPLLPEDLKQLALENPYLFKKPVEPSKLDAILCNYRAISTADQLRKYAGVALLNQQSTRAFGE